MNGFRDDVVSADVTHRSTGKGCATRRSKSAAHAYAPYSGFPVGAAALVDDGRIVAGCNVENVSYGLGLCAECAVVCALHSGGGGRLLALVCVDGAGNLLMPCGRCRQVLLEHGGPDLLIDHPARAATPRRAAARRLRARRSGACGARTGKAVTQFTFDAPTVIRTKRDGGRLSDEQIDWVIDAYTHGGVGDEQMAALLMAIFLRGMDRDEIARWTAAMIASGGRLDFSDLRRETRQDARWRWWTSTPPAASATRSPSRWCPSSPRAAPRCRRRPAAGSGTPAARWTSSNPFRVHRRDRHQAIRRTTGAMSARPFSPPGELAPADRKIYALRDITATVESLPLIASSIMSKKLAEGAGALVLDVKFGSGAFMKAQADVPRAGPHHGGSRVRPTACPRGRC